MFCDYTSGTFDKSISSCTFALPCRRGRRSRILSGTFSALGRLVPVEPVLLPSGESIAFPFLRSNPHVEQH
jgi:hypothetical protein